MHLADTFTQSDLHWFTFDQFVHSLGIEPVTMTLLAQCFTFFSEEPRRKVYSSVLFHKWAKATLNVPSIHLVHCYTSSEDLRCFLWGTHWNMIHTKSLLSHFSGEQIVPLRATVRLQKTWNTEYETYGCLLLYFHGAFLSFLSFADPMHIMEKWTCICVPHLVNDDRTFVFLAELLLFFWSGQSNTDMHVLQQRCRRLCMRRWRYFPFQHLMCSLPYKPEPEGTGGFTSDKTPFHAWNTREEMKFKSETCELKPRVQVSHKYQSWESSTGESRPE